MGGRFQWATGSVLPQPLQQNRLAESCSKIYPSTKEKVSTWRFFKNSSEFTSQGPPCSVTPAPSGFLPLQPVGPGQLLLFCWMSYCAQSGENGLCLALSSFQILPVNSQFRFCKIECVIFIPQPRETASDTGRPLPRHSEKKIQTKDAKCLRIMINLNTHHFSWLYLVWIYV